MLQAERALAESAAVGIRQWYRIWIMTFDEWRPQHWSEMPPFAKAVEPADEGLFSPDEAAAYLEGHNTTSLRLGNVRWAVAIPVQIRIVGDMSPGQTFVEGEWHRGGIAAR